MLDLITTLIRGANARAVETATDHFAIDLINQKIREAQAGVDAAKTALAALIMRQRHEDRVLEQLIKRRAVLEDRVRDAIVAGREDLAEQGACALADLENEATRRTAALAELRARVERLRHSVEKAYRRVADLRQGAMVAQAIDTERKSQRRLTGSLEGHSAAHEAEQLIRRVTAQDDPLAQSEIIEEIDRSLSPDAAEERLAEAGFGPATRVSTNDVLARLRNSLPTKA
jgi:phage shock protein A